MSNGAQSGDRELEQLLSETADLRQRYRASSVEGPPAALDEALRAAARREVKARPRLAGSPFSGSWRVPLSIAAVVVVTATLSVVLVERDAHLRPEIGIAPPPAAQAQRREAQPAPAAAIEEPTRTKLKGSSASSDAKQERRDAPAPVREENKSDSLKDEAAPSPSARVAPAAPPEPATGTFSQTAPSRPVLPSSENREAPQSPAAAKDEASPGPAGAGAIAHKENERAAGPSAAPAPQMATKGADTLAKKQAAPVAAVPGSVAPPWEQNPSDWLKHIDTLRIAGRIEEAKAGFEAFRRRYPDYPLPPGFVVPVP